MADIRIKKLNKQAYQQLRNRAKAHGVSMEEEARRIICQAVSVPERISLVFTKYFGLKNGVNLKLPNKRKPQQPMD